MTEDLRRCRECGIIFEPDVADRDRSGQPRCPQCFLAGADAAGTIDERETVIRTTTPFR